MISENPYEKIYSQLGIRISQQTTQQQAENIAKHLGNLYNTFGHAIKDLINILGYKFSEKTSKPSTNSLKKSNSSHQVKNNMNIYEKSSAYDVKKQSISQLQELEGKTKKSPLSKKLPQQYKKPIQIQRKSIQIQRNSTQLSKLNINKNSLNQQIIKQKLLRLRQRKIQLPSKNIQETLNQIKKNQRKIKGRKLNVIDISSQQEQQQNQQQPQNAQQQQYAQQQQIQEQQKQYQRKQYKKRGRKPKNRPVQQTISKSLSKISQAEMIQPQQQPFQIIYNQPYRSKVHSSQDQQVLSQSNGKKQQKRQKQQQKKVIQKQQSNQGHIQSSNQKIKQKFYQKNSYFKDEVVRCYEQEKFKKIQRQKQIQKYHYQQQHQQQDNQDSSDSYEDQEILQEIQIQKYRITPQEIQNSSQANHFCFLMKKMQDQQIHEQQQQCQKQNQLNQNQVEQYQKSAEQYQKSAEQYQKSAQQYQKPAEQYQKQFQYEQRSQKQFFYNKQANLTQNYIQQQKRYNIIEVDIKQDTISEPNKSFDQYQKVRFDNFSQNQFQQNKQKEMLRQHDENRQVCDEQIQNFQKQNSYKHIEQPLNMNIDNDLNKDNNHNININQINNEHRQQLLRVLQAFESSLEQNQDLQLDQRKKTLQLKQNISLSQNEQSISAISRLTSNIPLPTINKDLYTKVKQKIQVIELQQD